MCVLLKHITTIHLESSTRRAAYDAHAAVPPSCGSLDTFEQHQNFWSRFNFASIAAAVTYARKGSAKAVEKRS